MTTLVERFLAKVDQSGDCWEWTAGRSGEGYGRFWLDGRVTSAQRVAYELWVGPIPAGLEVDHTCHNPGCVRPAHLEAVTHGVNLSRRRDHSKPRLTSCRRAGHPFPEHAASRPNGSRYCRTCNARNRAARSTSHVKAGLTAGV